MPPRFEILAERDVHGMVKRGRRRRYRWRLLAANSEIVCASEGYHNKRDCEMAILKLRRWATEGLGLVMYRDGIPPSGNTSKWRNPFQNILPERLIDVFAKSNQHEGRRHDLR